MIINNNPKKKIVVVIGLALVIVLAAAVGWYLVNSKTGTAEKLSYEIPGVPYVGVFNKKDQYSLVSHDTTAATISVADYWNPGETNYVEADSFFRVALGHFIGFQKIEDYFEKTGNYNVSNVKLEVGELKKYINPTEKTPLILFLAIDEEQPLEVYYHPAKVLIGVDEPGKRITLHDYWLGNNYTISFDEFNKLWERMRPDERNKYLVVQPKNYKDIIKTKGTAQPYIPRTKTMLAAEDMFKNYAIGRGAQSQALNDVAMKYLSKVKDDANFKTYFPQAFKVNLYFRLAEAYLDLKNFDSAIAMANQAVELNHDLDKPLDDWPGISIGINKPTIVDRSSGPFRILGDIYKEQKEFEKAKENYQKALDIMPTNNLAVAGLKIAELELAKGTK